MRIQDMELQTGLDRATIRFYEKEGLIAPQRQENGYRIYTDEDAQLLLKVKLLRQLGISLPKIKSLQQGSEDFSLVLIQQIELIEKQIQNDERAKHVCVEIQKAGEEYRTLDAIQYLQMLDAPSVGQKAAFKEAVKAEHHPWRRYFARTIDYAIVSATIAFLVVCVFKIRPFSTTALKVLQYGSLLVAMPVLALLLHYFGTTPGKWAMGIRIEGINGGKLTFSDAFYRELGVLWYGFGLQIPFVSLWRLYKSYVKDTEGEGNSWNDESEIIFTDWTFSKKAVVAVLYAGAILLNTVASFDTMLPRHRGEGITLVQFVDNYQMYEKSLDRQNQYVLSADGTWVEQTHSTQYIVFGEDHERQNFNYEFDADGCLKSVSYTDQWQDANMMEPIPAFCTTAAYAVIGSRPGATYRDNAAAESMITSEINDKIVEASKQGSFCGDFLVNDVKISWDMEIENCDFVSDSGWMIALDDEKIPYMLEFKIEIQK